MVTPLVRHLRRYAAAGQTATVHVTVRPG